MRRSASIRNNCGTGPKIKVPNYGSTKHPNYGCAAVKLRAENPVAGNGIFGCGDGAPKIATKKRQRGQRPKSGKGAAGNPRRKALFDVVSETGGLRRLDGGRTRARTWDPMIKSQRLLPGNHRNGRPLTACSSLRGIRAPSISDDDPSRCGIRRRQRQGQPDPFDRGRKSQGPP